MNTEKKPKAQNYSKKNKTFITSKKNEEEQTQRIGGKKKKIQNQSPIKDKKGQRDKKTKQQKSKRLTFWGLLHCFGLDKPTMTPQK